MVREVFSSEGMCGGCGRKSSWVTFEYGFYAIHFEKKLFKELFKDLKQREDFFCALILSVY